MKVLITAGATREPIDAVRFLSNVSTGQTGAALTDALYNEGYSVTLLHGEGAAKPRVDCPRQTFTSTANLSDQLRQLLSKGDYDLVIMAAAVSDYHPANTLDGKMPSNADELTLRLVRNAKILPQLKTFSPQRIRVIGFKLTVGANAQARRAAVSAQFAAGGVDLVVQNDLDEIRAAPRERHPFRLYRSADSEPDAVHGVVALARALAGIVDPNRVGTSQTEVVASTKPTLH
jgi:phosphopantothenate---cysteine ligase (CTP)